MEDHPQCQSCRSKDKVGFNYGLSVCNACKQSIRRIPNLKKEMTCKSEGKDCSNKKCKRCNFSRLVLIGANFFREIDKDGILLNQLSIINQERSDNFLTCQSRDLSFKEVLNDGFLPKRTMNQTMTSHDWASLQMETTVNFMKKFHVSRLLTSEDFCLFAKKTYFKCAIFIMAMESKEMKMERMVFPGNIDVFPEESVSVQLKEPKLFNAIRCHLISKIIELNIKKEEFLLLSVIIASDPDIEELSDHGKQLILCFQNEISSKLMKFCMQSYDRNGPNRFCELINLTQILTKTMEKLEITSTLFGLCGVNTNKLVKEFF